MVSTDFLDPHEQIANWTHYEDAESEYCWRHKYEPDRFELKLSETDQGYKLDYTDFTEIAYGLVGVHHFESEEAAFRYALDFMEQFEIENWD